MNRFDGELWFIADTHFFHKRILEFVPETRPFYTVEEHNRHLVEQWNDCVKPADTVWHLGDVALDTEPEELAELLVQLHGFVHLVPGNHDTNRRMEGIRAAGWTVEPMLVMHPEVPVILCHFPLEAWAGGAYRDCYHFHGHTHGGLPGKLRRRDVGIDVAPTLRPKAWTELT